MASPAVQLRLGAALLAVAAGATGIVVAVQLLRSMPGPVGPLAGSPLPAAPAQTVPGGRIPTPDNPTFPSPPFGAVVAAREAGSQALGLAVVPGRPTSLVRVSVLSRSGSGATGLDVTVRLGKGVPVTLLSCGGGCYQSEVANAGGREVSVALNGKSYPFELPVGRALPDGTRLLNRAATLWRGLKTLVWHERLASNPTDAIHTIWSAVAPDELGYVIDNGSSAVIIGGKRWDRSGRHGRWIPGIQDPPLQQPQPFWQSALDARVLGSGRLGGHRVWDVTFFDPKTPGWFDVKIDQTTGLVLDLDMTAVAHFMHHVYGPFNAPLRLHPPIST